MYLTFRAVELALTSAPEEAIEKALTLRFHTRGALKDGKVLNYDDRYQDGIDMIRSGRYPPGEHGELRTGDIIFFVRDPSKSEVAGIVAHMGILKVEQRNGGSGRTVYLIHASGTKRRGGSVKKVLLDEYLTYIQHAGAKISRLNDDSP